jgi:signal transduction histidine kinase
MKSIPLHRAFFVVIAVALLAGLVPAGLVLDRRLQSAIQDQVRADLELAPRLWQDRENMSGQMIAMHANAVASTPGLAEALMQRDESRAMELAAQTAAGNEGERPIVVGGEGQQLAGAPVGGAVIAATRRGEVPVVLMVARDTLQRIALAPVRQGGVWVGAAGVSAVIDETVADVFAGLTRADVTIVDEAGRVAASTTDEQLNAVAGDSATAWRTAEDVVAFRPVGGPAFLIRAVPLDGAGTMIFARNLDRALSLVPALRRTVMLAAVWALVLALVLGGATAAALTRPVRAVAHAADRLSVGDFGAPLPDSRVREVRRVAGAFDTMRRALQARLAELEEANRQLEERQQRLAALQTELIQRERLAASGRMGAELAHEIRNPVANVRNCLEVLRRRLEDDDIGREFADLAIDELLRMHELAERMLDLNRPADPDVETCDVTRVLDQVAALVRAGASGDDLTITVHPAPQTMAAIPPDALKQVLINVVQNAREAVEDSGRIDLHVTVDSETVRLEVVDTGPGIAAEMLETIFDPFVTSKSAVHGVGLGLFVAEGIARRYGGHLRAGNREDGTGARFVIELAKAETEIPVADRGAQGEEQA